MRHFLTFLFFVVLGKFAFSADQPAVQLPADVKAIWDIDKAQREVTQTRESICINGLWQWQPTAADVTAPPTENWGWFKVPGCWPGITDYMQKDSQQVYVHPNWQDAKLSSVTKAWYQREIEIPANWKGRCVLLKADYVNSRAVVYIDGKRVGEILYPAGKVDLAEVCEPGRKHLLSIEVTALPLADVIAKFSDTNAPTQGTATVNRRGLCGDLSLVSEPKGPHISDVRIETSVRENKITVHVSLENLEPDTIWYWLDFNFFDKNKRDKSGVMTEFQRYHLVDGCITTTILIPPNEREFWDIHTPENMYEVAVKFGDYYTEDILRDIDEFPSIRFGFREFWIDERDLYLNGSRIWLSCVPLDNAMIGAATANYDAAKETMLRLKSFGVNFVYMHNYDCNPGSFLSFAEILRAADDVGMLISFSQPHFGHFDWSSPDAETANGYKRIAEFLVREAQNHPSVVFYSMSHNGTGYSEDMNPFLMDGIADPRSRWAKNNVEKALRAEAIVRQLDPSRIVYHHASGNLGSMHLSNFYGNWIPIQEMSDWFGHWAAVGTKPMFTCEYGVPFTWDWAMYRGWYNGVREFGSAPAPWEFCNAEWNAQFFGDVAFKIDEPEKRNLRWEAKQFHDGKVWHRWDYPHPLGSRDFTDQDLVFEKYITDNWRAFRTWGLSINSFWEHGRLWSLKPGVDKSRKDYVTDWDNLQRPGFSPDYVEQRYERIDIAFERDDWIPSLGAEALIRNNMPLLGYIAGKDGAFTSKDHNFLPGETVEKQLVIVNNSRKTVSGRYGHYVSHAFINDGQVVESSEQWVPGDWFTLETGTTKQIKSSIHLSDMSGTYTSRTVFIFDGMRPMYGVQDGKIIDVTAPPPPNPTEKSEIQEDTFTIHVMPKPEPIAAMNIALFDPKGETQKLLGELGVTYRLINDVSEVKSGDIVILGKDALNLSGNGFDLTSVPDGMKVIVFEQTAETLEKRLGFRVAEYGLRNVFKRMADHPLLENISDDNLRDWRGAATLLPEQLDYTIDDNVFNGVPTVEWSGITVPRVWRCGNRGNVASVLIEKPTCGDFLPILDGGFSLQYSPLMEYRQGKGMILFCQMDVTGRTEDEPAATHLVGNMLRYVNEWKAEPKRKIVYFGNEAEYKYLGKVGTSFELAFVTETLEKFGWEGNSMLDRRDILTVLAPGQKSEMIPLLRSSFLDDQPLGLRELVLGIGLNEEELKEVFPEITVKNEEHISTYFEPFGMNSPLRGIGPADVHNRDPRVYPLVTDGADVVGDGILAVADEGRTVICGMAPWQFPADQQSFKRTFRRSAFTVARLLGNMNVDLQTPLPDRFHGQVGADEKRWLDGLYLDQPEEWDDPYRFFRW